MSVLAEYPQIANPPSGIDIHVLPEKTSVDNNDEFIISDSADGFLDKKVTLSTLNTAVDSTASKIDFAATTTTAALGQALIYACTDTNAARTLTISTATIQLGSPTDIYQFSVKDQSGGAGTNNITIDTESGTIDGAASILINVNYASVKLYTDGTNVYGLPS